VLAVAVAAPHEQNLIAARPHTSPEQRTKVDSVMASPSTPNDRWKGRSHQRISAVAPRRAPQVMGLTFLAPSADGPYETPWGGVMPSAVTKDSALIPGSEPCPTCEVYEPASPRFLPRARG
jgi:hypothetical protein